MQHLQRFIHKDKLKAIIDKKVRELYLIIWPPFGESDVSQIDISIGFIFDDDSDELFIISTDKNDLTSPIVEKQTLPEKTFLWSEFEERMSLWMRGKTNATIENEYYDVSESESFRNIVMNKIKDVELVAIVNGSPIGVKVIFEYDYILSTPIIDGNTIETSSFNRNENLKHFKALGEIEYRGLS